MLKAPAFWTHPQGHKHPLAILLSPLAALYVWGGQRKLNKIEPAISSLPVVCVGNITLGGVGKTPFAIFLSSLLKDEKKISFLTRGYGGSEKGPHFVKPQDHFSLVGDEPLLLARHDDVCVSRDRVIGAAYLSEFTDAEVIIMDDGFQNPALQKDISLILIDAVTGLGNHCVFPAGPLRETSANALSRSHAVVFVLPDPNFHVSESLQSLAKGIPSFKAWLAPDEREVARMSEKKYLGFCGIGRPEKFWTTCEAAGISLIKKISFADHHAYTRSEIETLVADAGQMNAELLTTEKDMVRIDEDLREKIEILPVRMQLDKPEALKELILTKIANRKKI